MQDSSVPEDSDDEPTPTQLWARYGYPPNLQRFTNLVQAGEVASRSLPPFTPEFLDDFESFVAISAVVRQGLQFGKAVEILLINLLPDTCGPLVRALDEVLTDVQYALHHGSRIENVRKMRIAATLELDYHRRSRNLDETEPSPTVELMRAQYPDLVAQVQAKRRKNQSHWSGLSRTKLVEAVAGDAGKNTYRILSWEAHSVMPPIRDVSLGDDHSTIEFSHATHPYDHVEQVAYSAGVRLYSLWNEWAAAFRIPELKIREETTSVWLRHTDEPGPRP